MRSIAKCLIVQHVLLLAGGDESSEATVTCATLYSRTETEALVLRF